MSRFDEMPVGGFGGGFRMTAAHTPGPWHAVCDPEKTAKRKRMALVATHSGNPHDMAIDCTDSGKNYAEDCANARLIAAAPQLAEALRVIAEACERYGLADVGDINPAKVARAALTAAGITP
jgi:hypothetical protein